MALILIIIIIIHCYKNVFAHKRYYYAYDSNATSISASMFRVHKYTYENGVQFEIKSL